MLNLNLKPITVTAVAVLMLLCFTACGKKNSGVSFGVTEDTKFGAVHIDCSIEDFNAAGFAFGDSVDIRFSNGEEMEDIPYFDGYYVKTGEPLVCGYPGYAHPAIAFSSGDAMWKKLGMTEQDTVTVTLREKGKYLDVQESLSMVYSNDRSDFAADAVFGNFRAMCGGSMKPDTFYRGASPINDEYSRAGTVNRLLAEADIAFILDLADNAEDIADYIASDGSASGYRFMELSGKGSVALLDLSAAYRSESYAQTLVGGLRQMMGAEGRCYIHCTEGKDRTGFVCLLLEALCGADYGELERDYMVTYDNYYGINEQTEPVKYAAIRALKLDDMLEYLSGVTGEALRTADYAEGAKAYLRFGGMNDSEIESLISFLTK